MSLKRTYYPGNKIPNEYRFRHTLNRAIHDQDHSDSNFILSWCMTDGGGKKEYISVRDETSCFDLINNTVPEHRRFSECIQRDNASRVHFDADLSYKDIPDDEDEFSHYQFLQGVCQFIILFMKDYYGKVVTMSDFHITTACTDKKMSFHILLLFKFKDLESRRQFKTCLDNAKSVLKNDGSLMYRIIKITSSIDVAIYTKNRVFRLMGNCKEGQINLLKPIDELRDYSTKQPSNEVAMLIFAKWPEDERERFNLGMLTSVKSLDYPTLCNTINEKIIESEPTEPSNNSGTMRTREYNYKDGPPNGKALMATVIQFINDKHPDYKFEYDGFDNLTDIYAKSTCEWTCPCGNEHSSNNHFHIVLENHQVSIRCTYSSQNCTGKLQSIGKLPPMPEVPCEPYYKRRDNDQSKAAAADFKEDFTHEGSEYGVGKTTAVDAEVLRSHTERTPEWQKTLYEFEKKVKDFWFLEGGGNISNLFDADKNRDRAEKLEAFRQFFVDIENPDHENYMPFKGERVLVISHRRTLLSEFGSRYKKLGFVMYDETKDFSNATRLIVCINSVWKIKTDDWDLVVIDETQQVLLAMCKLVKTGESGSSVDVFTKLRSIVTTTKRFISMSADGGLLCKVFFDACNYISVPIDEHRVANGRTIKWVANDLKSLKGNTYHFITHDKDCQYYEVIDEHYLRDEMEGGNRRIMLPFAEKKALQRAEIYLRNKYPDADIITIHGDTRGLPDENGVREINQKSKNIQLIKTRKFDFVLFTATVDCGVSFDLEYDVVICRLNVRSITAGVVMQILHRCRNVKEKLFIIVQDNRCVDYDEHPGYTSRPCTVEEAAAPSSFDEDLSSCTSVKQALEHLKQFGMEESYTWLNSKENKIIFTRKQKPFEVTVGQAMDQLINPCIINSNLRAAKKRKLEPTLKIAITVNAANLENCHVSKYPALLHLCSLARQEELNKHTNMIVELKNKMQLQGSTVICSFAPEPIDHDNNIEDEANEILRDDAFVEMNSIFDAEILSFKRLQEINFQPTEARSEADKHSLSKEHMIRSFGLDYVQNARTTLADLNDKAEALAKENGLRKPKFKQTVRDLTEFENQRLYQKMCCMLKKDYKKELLPGSIKDNDLEYLSTMNPKHTPAQELALYNVITSWGFSGPNDTSTVTIDPDDNERLELMRAAVKEYQTVNPAKRKAAVAGTRQIAKQSQGLIEEYLKIRPSRGSKKGDNRVNKYTLQRVKEAKSFPPPSLQQHELYAKWCTKLNTPGASEFDGDDDDDDDNDGRHGPGGDFDSDSYAGLRGKGSGKRGLYDSDEDMEGFDSDFEGER